MADDYDRRLRVLEAAEAVGGMRLVALEEWRRRDEPRVSELVHDGELADAVRDALAHRSRWELTLAQKIAGALCGLVVVAGGITQIVQAVIR